MSEDNREKISLEEVKQALTAVRAEGEPDLSDVLTLVGAGFDHDRLFVPEAVRDAVVAKWETDRDFANGGMDQFVWNNGIEMARWVANAWRAVGAVENADLVDRLAGELEAYFEKVLPEEISKDPIKHFMAFRKKVDGPFFDCPDPGEEVGVALVEYVVTRRREFPDQEDVKAET